ncbi:Protein of unknown function DUF2314 [Cellulophaga algicola DSM 14237]|uniref:DUF2314 domain-containing protein n=1 Tax=Cellulophaga algicola (strain DSM 14237 / IC166 / ACAM 630) TaxID=688270 RepID=E6X8G1_CELAD|nr:DUF2314 domain-containing protein [Cellulophaga algicola]ADV50817.1 Protein of unknown function DUF2314 [Cellulophaga algicola DSM 14237]
MKYLIFIFLSCFILSCSEKKKDKKANMTPTVAIKNSDFHTSYGIYSIEEKDSISTFKIEQLVAKLLPTYKLADSITAPVKENKYTITQFSNPKNEYPAPSMDYLQHSAHNLSEEEMNSLQSPKKAVLINFSGTHENVIADQIQINSIIDSLIHSSTAMVTDYITYETFNSTSWKKDRVASFTAETKDITSQFTIHLYRDGDGDFCRAVTLGMRKFCLPDISIENISCRDSNSYASLINLLGQTLLELPKITKDSTVLLDINNIANDSVKSRLLNSLEENALKKGVLQLKSVEPQEGDDYNTQFQIVFNTKGYSSPQEEQQELISTIFGATDAITFIEHEEDILSASNRAKQKLPEFQKLFNNGLEPGYAILLKAPFKTDEDGQEWMWIEVTKWEGSTISGILQNDPFQIADLKAGAIVSAKQEAIFDYIYYHPDGTSEGNETGEIISKRAQ